MAGSKPSYFRDAEIAHDGAAKLRSAIEWHENYMRFHDGDPDYRVL